MAGLPSFHPLELHIHSFLLAIMLYFKQGFILSKGSNQLCVNSRLLSNALVFSQLWNDNR